MKGIVVDSAKKPIPFATVNLKNDAVIIAYTVTDTQGAFSIVLPADVKLSQLMAEAVFIGYEKQTLHISGTGSRLSFLLQSTVNQLKTITVKDYRPKIRLHGDTLSYKVAEFGNGTDRVIGDVIKKLPGIDVAQDGRISYMGII